MVKKIKGWVHKGKQGIRPFSLKEFKNSYIKKAMGGERYSYDSYLKLVKKIRRRR